MRYRIKGWKKFQHFKDRKPPWIKLYRDLLDDMDWHELDGDSAKALVSLWLIASENEGELPEPRKLAFRLRISEKALQGICSKLSHWIEPHDDSVISSEYHDDAPETETETETEKNMSGPSSPDGFEQFWKAYPRTPNMSKSAALKAWQKQKAVLPPTDQLLVAVAKYRAFLAAETKKNGREYPAKHAQGWLNEQRWIGFQDGSATEPSQAQKHAADWADEIPEWSAFKSTLHPTEWVAWFSKGHPNGSTASLVAETTFQRDEVAARYLSRLQSHFGEHFQLKVKQ